jgi:hypothetical protein
MDEGLSNCYLALQRSRTESPAGHHPGLLASLLGEVDQGIDGGIDSIRTLL